jgi:hypothetical protein
MGPTVRQTALDGSSSTDNEENAKRLCYLIYSNGLEGQIVAGLYCPNLSGWYIGLGIEYTQAKWYGITAQLYGNVPVSFGYYNGDWFYSTLA